MERQTCAQTLRRLRLSRGWSWSDEARVLRGLAQALRFQRLAMNNPSSIQRTIARWESAATVPNEQYRILLAHAFARTATGESSLGPGSDFDALLSAFAGAGVSTEQLDELRTSVAVSLTRTGVNLLAFVSESLQGALAGALADPARMAPALLGDLAASSEAVGAQIGSVPFARLHLAQAAIVDVCRRLFSGPIPDEHRPRLAEVTASVFAQAARLAFETHDDASALALYAEAVSVAGASADTTCRALIRTSQAMVVHYATGDLSQAQAIADQAVQDARRVPNAPLQARAYALQAEMAARTGRQRATAENALRLAWRALDQDTANDPGQGVFSKGRLRGFEGVCGIFLGSAEEAERQLARSAQTLTRPRDTVQRAIVLTDQSLARLNTGGPGAAESSATMLHECVDLIAATRGRVPSQRLRQVRLSLRPWRTESFVADLDDHIHTSLIGV
ncbi:hypothetical protein LO762_15675 [Actinocorallia sp. API 0066]|uniref:hypothetical protein n=1 Tax=Actinocorallia sp. API 0066 TaxID=2896846 RepID=UPI001E379AA1|nr:hypothetical protein [Actinocorallia sp. API 0066]MCD0450618.1 hypothetical protein [Actinocorallia sp. API 0066]